MVNYDQTVVYKIVCLDPKVTNFFVGATTHWAGMRWKHGHESWDHHEKRYNSLLSVCVLEKMVDGVIFEWFWLSCFHVNTNMKRKPDFTTGLNNLSLH